jgi:D-sedoheptulose 7-phosphate isomerase
MKTKNNLALNVISHIEESLAAKEKILEHTDLIQNISGLVIDIVDAFKRGNKVMFAGNGGSAADAQHLAAEFVSRFYFDRPGLPSLALSTDTSMLTAIGNDYGFNRVFARQIEAQARAGDVFIGITTSGRSENIIAAFEVCRALSVKSVALCGEGGSLEGKVDCVLRVPSKSTPRIQECHILIGHIICAEVESQLFCKDNTR